jgi:hypothetical protein
MSPTTKAALIGGAIGAGLISVLGMWLKVRELQTAERQAQIEAEVSSSAEAAALDYLATGWGLTPTRIEAIRTFARRFDS